MLIYKKESLEVLRQRIDLVEVLSSHLQLHRAGSAYKACCPFHEEKTPSFVVQKGDSHYHCYGCGAHGDAIAFLMGHVKMSFLESVESLAERFQVVLEKVEDEERGQGASKATLKNVLEKASRFYEFILLHADEGRIPLQYLFKRGITVDFIRQFRLGYAPKQPDFIQCLLREEGIDESILHQVGLITQSGRKRDFFSERITFPICDPLGAVIGFSARKWKEETFGGKYINTPETPLFKKSHTLFGLQFCRQRIAKQRKAIIVEGQLDALRLIHTGFNFTVAGQGTAFGEGHIKELLNLGVNHVFLALDGDEAGQEATVKIGNLFQKKGVEVSAVSLPKGSDPDAFLKEKGPPAFLKLLDESQNYLTFLFKHLSRHADIHSPSQKNELVQTIAERIRGWDHPLMVHESLRQLAEIADVPETAIGVGKDFFSEVHIKRQGSNLFQDVDPDRILETDLLRWLFLMGESQPELIEIVHLNLKPEHFRIDICRRLFALYLNAFIQKTPRDLMTLAISFGDAKEQLFLSEIMQKKVNLQKAKEGVLETVHKILLRQWMEEREAIKTKIHSGTCSDDEALQLAKQFDLIKKAPPEVIT